MITAHVWATVAELHRDGEDLVLAILVPGLVILTPFFILADVIKVFVDFFNKVVGR